MAEELSKEAALAARKQRLVTEGQLYRVSIEHAKVNVTMALRPEALLHGVMDNVLGHVFGIAGARLGSLGGLGSLLSASGLNRLLAPGGVNLRAVLPFMLTAGSFIMRRRLLKPLIGVGVAAGIATIWLRNRNTTQR